jgi:hypothetical protein
MGKGVSLERSRTPHAPQAASKLLGPPTPRSGSYWQTAPCGCCLGGKRSGKWGTLKPAAESTAEGRVQPCVSRRPLRSSGPPWQSRPHCALGPRTRCPALGRLRSHLCPRPCTPQIRVPPHRPPAQMVCPGRAGATTSARPLLRANAAECGSPTGCSQDGDKFKKKVVLHELCILLAVT